LGNVCQVEAMASSIWSPYVNTTMYMSECVTDNYDLV